MLYSIWFKSESLNYIFFPSPEEKPKPDAVLKSPSPVLRLVLSGEKKEQAGQTSDFIAAEPLPELPLSPSPAIVSSLARNTATSPISAALSSQTLFTAIDDRCELSSSKEDTFPIPSPASCRETSDPSPTDKTDADIFKTQCDIASTDIPLIANSNLINEMNGMSEKVSTMKNIVEIEKQEALPLTLELEILEHAPEEMKLEHIGAPITPSTVPCFPPSPPASPSISVIIPASAINVGSTNTPTTVQRVLEEDENIRTCLSDDTKEILNKLEVEADGQTEDIMDSQNLSSQKSPIPGKLFCH